MEYLPFWNLENSQKHHYLTNYLRKYSNKKTYYTFSRIWWSYYFTCFKELGHPLPQYLDIFKTLSENSLRDLETYKIHMPKKHWHLIPYYYYQFTKDPTPMWGYKIDSEIMELFNLVSMFQHKRRLNISHFGIIGIFLAMLGQTEYASIYEIQGLHLDHTVYRYEMNQILGWGNNFLVQKKNWKDRQIPLLIEWGIPEIMISDITQEITDAYSHFINSKFK